MSASKEKTFKSQIFQSKIPKFLNESINVQENQIKNIKLSCKMHPDFEITNICISNEENCNGIGLCPECLVSHIEFHNEKRTLSNIKTLKYLRIECKNDISQKKKQLLQKKNNFNQFLQNNKSELEKNFTEQIDNARKKLNSIIDNYFITLKEKMEDLLKNEKLNQSNSHFFHLSEKINEILIKYDKILNKIDGQKCLKAINKVIKFVNLINI